MDHQQPLCAAVQAKILEQVERTQHLIDLLPPGRADWAPAIPDAMSVGHLLGHLLDCLAGFCAVLYAVSPDRLAHLAALRHLRVNHDCPPAEASSRIAQYRAAIEEGFAVIQDSDLPIPVPTVFVIRGELLITLLLGNLEHLINHKYQLFLYLKMLGVEVRSSDLYRFREE